MPLFNPYSGPQRLTAGPPVVVDEGTLFNFEAATIHPTIGMAVDMPLARDYEGSGGTETASANTWPLEYQSGSPVGRRVLTVGKDSGSYRVYNAIQFASLSWLTTTGTFVIGVTPLNATDTFGRILEFSDGTLAERIGILRHGTDCLIRVEDGNSQVVRLTAGTLAANSYSKIALSYEADSWRVSVNGAVAVTTSSGTVPTVTEGHIGGLNGIASGFRMHTVRHWDSIKSDLRGLSAL